MGALIEVNTDGLAKLAETVGGWFGWNARAIEHKAEAEAFAAVRKVDAENATNLARLQGEEQFANYILAREKRKMNNAISVVDLAQTQFTEGEQASDEPVNPDWLNRFFSIVENVSDAEMQQLWARILAGEVKKPKSYSLRTLEILRNITKEEAEQISDVSAFVVYGGMMCSEDFGINSRIIPLLDELGLICGEEMVRRYTITPNAPRNIVVDKSQLISLYSSSAIKVELKYYILTRAGREIFTLPTQPDTKGFVVNLVHHFKQYGLNKITLNHIEKWEGEKYYYIEDNAIEL